MLLPMSSMLAHASNPTPILKSFLHYSAFMRCPSSVSGAGRPLLAAAGQSWRPWKARCRAFWPTNHQPSSKVMLGDATYGQRRVNLGLARLGVVLLLTLTVLLLLSRESVGDGSLILCTD